MENQRVLPDAIRGILFCFMLRDEWSTDTHKEKLRQITGNYKLEKCLYALWYLASLNEVSKYDKSSTVSTRK